MSSILATVPLGRPPWPTLDPFLFCVHHLDDYPAGDAAMGPAASLAGRQLGMDFEGIGGWRMYHGRALPGFPRHPHRGFETVTLARRGFIDHSDSLGATARFGEGDVQWMTAGRGIEHSEVFPLLRQDADNPLELFQLWLNLPRASKLAAPHFQMSWRTEIPRRALLDAAARPVEVVVVTGALFDGMTPPRPPPASWAAREGASVVIATLRAAPSASVVIPAAAAGLNRVLYYFAGAGAQIDGRPLRPPVAVQLRSDAAVTLVNGAAASELLLLQGRPIGEPVAQQGPFVMNTREELARAFEDYRSGAFGRWPWADDEPAHARARGRFAVHADGRQESPPGEGAGPAAHAIDPRAPTR